MAQTTPPRAFISFDFDNNETDRNLFVGQAKNSKTPFEIHDWSSKRVLPQSQWEAIIKGKINQTHLMIVLVGPKSASAVGVAKEIEMARECNVPFFGVRVGGAGTNTALPAGLARDRVIDWNWDTIANAISQMMGEGKNR